MQKDKVVGFLTERECRILELQSEGKQQRDIVKELRVKQPTVSEAMKKIDEKIHKAKETLAFVESLA